MRLESAFSVGAPYPRRPASETRRRHQGPMMEQLGVQPGVVTAVWASVLPRMSAGPEARRLRCLPVDTPFTQRLVPRGFIGSDGGPDRAAPSGLVWPVNDTWHSDARYEMMLRRRLAS